MSNLKQRYRDEMAPALKKQLGFDNIMRVPRLEKVVVNIGVGEAIQNNKAMEVAQSDIEIITGQHPVVMRAKKSIAAFKLRQGMPVGLKVTLRGERMYDFVDRLINVALPRMREFRGVSEKSFDGRGNYSLGLKEQSMFPEIDYNKIDKLRGLEVCIVTSARTDEEGKHLLEQLGMPFSKD